MMFSAHLLLSASTALFALLVSAGRFSEVAHRKGFGPNIGRAFHQPEKRGKEPNCTDDFRFLNHDTASEYAHSLSISSRTKADEHSLEYRVDSLPDVPYDIGEMYSGLIPIDPKNASRALFFVFQPTVGEPVDEITIWMNGGPGALSPPIHISPSS